MAKQTKTAAITMTTAMMATAEDQWLYLLKSWRAKRSSLVDESSSSGDCGAVMKSSLYFRCFIIYQRFGAISMVPRKTPRIGRYDRLQNRDAAFQRRVVALGTHIATKIGIMPTVWALAACQFLFGRFTMT